MTGAEDDVVHIDIKAEPENNKANIELIRFLKKETGLDVIIVKGKTSKNKLVRFGH